MIYLWIYLAGFLLTTLWLVCVVKYKLNQKNVAEKDKMKMRHFEEENGITMDQALDNPVIALGLLFLMLFIWIPMLIFMVIGSFGKK